MRSAPAMHAAGCRASHDRNPTEPHTRRAGISLASSNGMAGPEIELLEAAALEAIRGGTAETAIKALAKLTPLGALVDAAKTVDRARSRMAPAADLRGPIVLTARATIQQARRVLRGDLHGPIVFH
jgi:hypothetical protein